MRKRMKVTICALAMLGISAIAAPVVLAEGIATYETVVNTTDVEPRTDILQWRYKVENGHLYKRLYNRSTGEWETDWILVQ